MILDYAYQLILAFIGSLGFGLLFRINLKKAFSASFGGIICWFIYLLCRDAFSLGIFTSSLMAAASSAIYAEILAYHLRCPAIIMYITALIPLIPGSGLYYTMQNIVHEEWQQAQLTCYNTIQCALGIAMGISLVYAMYRFWRNIQRTKM